MTHQHLAPTAPGMPASDAARSCCAVKEEE